jgi:hypothetical protein
MNARPGRVDTSRINSMFREIARKVRVPPEEIMVYEIGKILQMWLSLVPAADVNKLRLSYEEAIFSAQPATLYTPKSGRARVKLTKRGFVTYFLLNRYPDELWNAMSERRKASLLRRIAARGLAKQSVLQIADRLGVSISAPGYVRTALASTGKRYPENTSVQLRRRTGLLQITFENSQPTINQERVGGRAALQKAINGRVDYFLNNVARGVFDDVKNIAIRYPGMRVGTA